MRLVGRDQQIEKLHQFLSPSSPEWLCVLYGLPGVGKTSLLNYIRNELSSQGQSSALIDFELDKAYADVLRILSTNLHVRNISPDATMEYESEIQRISEWELNQRPIVNQTINAFNSVLDNITQSADIKRSDIQLSAARYRADAWRKLASSLPDDSVSIVIFVDHWEFPLDITVNEAALDRAVPLEGNQRELRYWLLHDVLMTTQKTQGLPALKVIIAGHRSLKYENLGDGVFFLELTALNESDVRDWLQIEGISDVNIQTIIVEYTDCNPLLVSLALAEQKANPLLEYSDFVEKVTIRASTEWFVNRLIRSLPEPSRAILQDGAILRTWRLGDLRKIFADKGLNLSEAWWHTFTLYPFIQDVRSDPGARQFIRIVREIRTGWLWDNDPDEFHQLHERAFEYFLESTVDK